MGAKTADHWVRRHIRHGQLRNVDWLVLEELTQIDISIWSDLATLSLTGLKILILGDFKQFNAAVNTWCGCDIVASLKESDMLFEMAGGVLPHLDRKQKERH